VIRVIRVTRFIRVTRVIRVIESYGASMTLYMGVVRVYESSSDVNKYRLTDVFY
jgi:hypothetical protein